MKNDIAGSMKCMIDMLQIIRNANNIWLEQQHSWIQVAFPLPTPSAINPAAPLLTPDLVHAIKQDTQAIELIDSGSSVFYNYLAETSHWCVPHNHNHLRITRVLLSISYTLGCGKSHFMLRQILKLCELRTFTPENDTLSYWMAAGQGLDYSKL